jgi:hypothetical protein
LSFFFYNYIQKLKYSGKIKDSKKLIIDSTTVANRLGSEEVSITPGSRKHKGTKIHVIATESKIPIGITFSDAKTHDSQKVLDTIKTIKLSTSRATILADKGYVDKKLQILLKKQKINFLAVPKRGMKKQLTELQKQKMEKRPRIEHFFASLKRFRINCRLDRSISSFASFCFIAFFAITVMTIG